MEHEAQPKTGIQDLKGKKVARLRREFYLRKPEAVARDLLGKKLVHVLPSGERLAGIIVECEAYLGFDDPGAHTYQGRRTKRVESMYKVGGHAYVYFTYGMHFCLNAVTSKEGVAQAVLLRALQPAEGLEIMRKLRKTDNDLNLTSGPGKICQAMMIDRKLDGVDLLGEVLFIEDVGIKIPDAEVLRSARIGLSCQHEAAQWPLRFFCANSPFVSKKFKVIGKLKRSKF